jgi:hypothetical protein
MKEDLNEDKNDYSNDKIHTKIKSMQLYLFKSISTTMRDADVQVSLPRYNHYLKLGLVTLFKKLKFL